MDTDKTENTNRHGMCSSANNLEADVYKSLFTSPCNVSVHLIRSQAYLGNLMVRININIASGVLPSSPLIQAVCSLSNVYYNLIGRAPIT